jgi:SNF2 family DNA or RNA helicase
MLTISYNSSADRFEIRTPHVIAAIGDWVGWARLNPHCYGARAWASSVLGVKAPTGMQLTWTEEAESKRDVLLHDLQTARSYLSGGQLPLLPPLPTERQPKRHQWEAVFAMRRMRWRCQLGDDMGLGKTSAALWAAEDSNAKTLLVVCPVASKFNWPVELEVTLGTRWTSIVFDGTRPKRASQLADAMASRRAGHPTALFINYDLLRWLTSDQLDTLCLFVRDGLVVFDECHYLKDRNADRTKLSRQVAASAPYVLGLSGTPICNLADDLFSQVEIIRPGTWTSYRDFAKRYLIIQAVDFGKRTVQKVVGTKNLDELNAVMNTLQIRRKKNDVLNLPPKIRTFPELELSGDHLAFYKAMKDFARIELEKLM